MKDKSSKVTKKILGNYRYCGELAIAPLRLSYELMHKEKNTGDYNFSDAFRLVGYLTLPGTILATPITALLGVAGAMANTAYAAVVLPKVWTKKKVIKPDSTQSISANSNRKMQNLFESETKDFSNVSSSPNQNSSEQSISSVKDNFNMKFSLTKKSKKIPQDTIMPNSESGYKFG